MAITAPAFVWWLSETLSCARGGAPENRGVSGGPEMTPNPSADRPLARISLGELALMLEKHGRFLKGQTHGQRLDLSMQCLSGLSFAGRNLDHSELRGADLTFCDLTNASLAGANLFCADLYGATLVACNLEKADLRGARLDHANLDRANLDGTDCREGALIRHDSNGFGSIKLLRGQHRNSSISTQNLNKVSYSLPLRVLN